MDGAGAWTQFRRITIPLMSPVLLYNLVIVLIGTFQYFTQAYVMTNGRGDPNNATLFINLVLYREGFVFNHMGYAAAIAWLLFVIVLGADAASCSGSPGAGSTTPAASDDRGAQTDADEPGSASATGRRSPRSYRKFLGRSMLLMFALIIISAYLLPLLYMVTTAFQQPGQSTTPGAPVWPAAPQTAQYAGPGLPGLHRPDPGRGHAPADPDRARPRVERVHRPDRPDPDARSSGRAAGGRSSRRGRSRR